MHAYVLRLSDGTARKLTCPDDAKACYEAQIWIEAGTVSVVWQGDRLVGRSCKLAHGAWELRATTEGSHDPV